MRQTIAAILIAGVAAQSPQQYVTSSSSSSSGAGQQMLSLNGQQTGAMMSLAGQAGGVGQTMMLSGQPNGAQTMMLAGQPGAGQTMMLAGQPGAGQTMMLTGQPGQTMSLSLTGQQAGQTFMLTGQQNGASQTVTPLGMPVGVSGQAGQGGVVSVKGIPVGGAGGVTDSDVACKAGIKAACGLPNMPNLWNPNPNMRYQTQASDQMLQQLYETGNYGARGERVRNQNPVGLDIPYYESGNVNGPNFGAVYTVNPWDASRRPQQAMVNYVTNDPRSPQGFKPSASNAVLPSSMAYLQANFFPETVTGVNTVTGAGFGYPDQIRAPPAMAFRGGYPGTVSPGFSGGYPGTVSPGFSGGYLGTVSPGFPGGYPGAVSPVFTGGYPGAVSPGGYFATSQAYPGVGAGNYAQVTLGNVGQSYYTTNPGAGYPGGNYVPRPQPFYGPSNTPAWAPTTGFGPSSNVPPQAGQQLPVMSGQFRYP